MADVRETLKQRHSAHGEFIENSKLSQGLKGWMESHPNWNSLPPMQQEALHMIAHKIGRIIAGDANHKDHWHDIAGYAILVEERLP